MCRHFPPLGLYKGRAGGGENVESIADADSLEGGDSSGVSGVPAGERDEYAVVEGDSGEHYKDGEDGEARRRDLEGGGHVAVHGSGLEDCEAS